MSRKRTPFRLVGDKQFIINTLLTILCLVLISGMAVLITNIGVIVQYRQEAATMSLDTVVTRIVVHTVGILALMFVLATLVVFVYAKKIAGPIYQLQTGLEKMLSGNFSSLIRFRSDDEFKNLGQTAEAFRARFIEMMGKSHEKIAGLQKDVSLLAEQLVEKKSGRAKDDVLETVNDIQKQLDDLKRYFTQGG